MRTIRKAIHGKIYWATATGIAILFVVVVVGLNPSGTSPSQAYAAVVQQLRNAVTVSFSAAWYFNESDTPTNMEMAYREPGIFRTAMNYNGAKVITIHDTNRDKGITLIPETKTYVEMALENMPSIEQERTQLIKLLNTEMKTLPEKADEILGERIIDGWKVQGFRIGSQTLWIDVKKNTLALIEKELGGTQLFLTNFRIDPVALSDSSFSITPPEDYISAIDGTITYDVSDSGEKDLVEYLRISSMWIEDHRFPSTVNPLEIMSLQKQGMLTEIEFQSQAEQQKTIQAFIQASQKAVTFVTSMKAESDWHYGGKGLKFGDSQTPIAWWKPEDSETYRVVWGDLSVSNVEADAIPELEENGR